ncbi:MAG: hypothetical protein AB7S26_39770 [Sandaracinaceae bacterium]
MRLALLGLACASSIAIVVPAHAQRPPDERQARSLWAEGRALADDGDLEGALDRFERSFALVERASTALSIATVAVRLDRPERALAALDDLERIADPDRDAEHLEAGRRVREAALAAIAARPPAEPEPTPEPEPGPPPEPVTASARDPWVPLIGPIALLGAGVATFIAAIATFVVRGDQLGQRDALCPQQICATEADRTRALALHADADTLNTATNVLDVVGAVLLAGGATWLVLELTLDRDEGDAQVALTLQPGGLGLHGSFR